MKILHLISQPPDFTGSGKFISQLIRQSAAHGHQNILLAGAQKDFQLSPGLTPASHHHLVRFEQEIPFPIPGMSDIMPYESRKFSSLTEQELTTYKQTFSEAVRTVAAQHRPDIIHSHHLWILSALSREILPDIPMVTSCHGTCLRQHRLCPEIGQSLINSLGSINRIIALSRSQENEIHHLLKIPSARIDVISGGFDPECFFDTPKPHDGKVHLLFAGKLSPAKGLIWLLNSLREIKNQPFCLHIAGSSSEKEKKACLDLAATLGDKVRYHGVLSHQELGALMRRSHLFILPSFFEGVPLVVMEAAASGCKIITTALDGTRELLEQAPEQMADLIDLPPLKTIDQPYAEDQPMLEKKLTRILGKNIRFFLDNRVTADESTRSYIQAYTWPKIFEKIQRLYSEMQ